MMRLPRLTQILRLIQTLADHSLHANLSKSVAILFGDKKVCSRVENRLNFMVGDGGIVLVDRVKNLGLIVHNTIRYRQV